MRNANTLMLPLLVGALGAARASEETGMMQVVDTTVEPMQAGAFEPTWASLRQYEAPAWFRDAKFGIWAHWGPQCQPEAGDWYARHMYFQGHRQYRYHLEHYGHPSEVGFKDVIHAWKADRWDPDRLVALYKRAGAQYVFAMANHHDNLDLWDSRHQPWNSVEVGPRKNIIGGWAEAARRHGLRFGISMHAAHAWTWYESSQGADREGPLAGVPYDGSLTREDGKGQWWEGLDPQDLYAQDHPRSAESEDPGGIHARWHWSNGASLPDAAYCETFYNRSVDVINKYRPDLVYFDDTALPLWPVSDAGLKIAAHYYNSSTDWHNGSNEAVLLGKILDEEQRRCMVWDIERGALNEIAPEPWQTCTCIGGWHYDRALYEREGYKDARTVIHMLADIVSKNGNLLLSIPLRGDGSLDEKAERVVEGIAEWMQVHRESILGTRPWKVFGEGPATEGAPIAAQGFNEGKGKPTTEKDVRFTTREGAVYAIVLGAPAGTVHIKALGTSAGLLAGAVERVELLGSAEAVTWRQEGDGLFIYPPPTLPSRIAVVFKVGAGSGG